MNHKEREQHRKQLLIDAFKAWISSGRKGTKPRKARIGRKRFSSIQTKLTASRNRVKRQMTKRMQQTRVRREQNVRTGKRG